MFIIIKWLYGKLWKKISLCKTFVMITITFKRKRKWFLKIEIWCFQCNYKTSALTLMYMPGNTSSVKLQLYCITHIRRFQSWYQAVYKLIPIPKRILAKWFHLSFVLPNQEVWKYKSDVSTTECNNRCQVQNHLIWITV